MPRIIIFTLVLAAALGFILYQLSKFFLSINGGRSRLEKEAIILRQKLSQLVDDLIPFNQEEFLDLSALRNNKSTIVGGYTLGTLSTIFSEELISYGKIRLTANDYSVLVAKSKSSEIIYTDYNTHTQVLVDSKLIGAIDLEGVLRDKENKILASIDIKNLSKYKPIKSKEKELGQVIYPAEDSSINTRAFQLVKPMDKDEEMYFKILAIYLLLQD